MILYFGDPNQVVFAVQTSESLDSESISKLQWLFGNQKHLNQSRITGSFIGPRANMITPWSTNAVDITQNMGIVDIIRIERFDSCSPSANYDPMLRFRYAGLDQESFTINFTTESIKDIEDIAAYNKSEGLALSDDEITYLLSVAKRLGRPLTDSEVFGFSQVNSEHCRHKIFNGTFVLDGKEEEETLFQLIKKTSKENPNAIVSAYKDNVAFIDGPAITQFAPEKVDQPDYYTKEKINSIISLKAETHNFPTTVEPFNGAATGSGGEIRDRMAGGRGSIPLAGTALYMTAYPRFDNKRKWVEKMAARPWLYQTPLDILIKASNGASDFGNKFGQPLINGSLLTFEHEELSEKVAYDKVIMMAGGIGYAKKEQAQKDKPAAGDKIVILGGDNYRIGMGGAAVSSAEGGEFNSGIELNAVQRSNPEMQKRVANVVRALVESSTNPIVSIHDHGAGGHLNCLSELVEDTGGVIDIDKLPVGDPTLSAKELIGNESQERMGLIIKTSDLKLLQDLSARERAPMYVVGDVTDDMRFTFQSSSSGIKPMDLALEDMFGNSPKTILADKRSQKKYSQVTFQDSNITEKLSAVLKLEAVACKDWLTNKVDRCVGGRVAKQQCCGPLQLPLNNCGVMALDFEGKEGIATSMGHAPIVGLIDPVAGSRTAITEALTNIIWAPLKDGLKSISLSANWMWPAKNPGENARLYDAVKAVSEFCIDLGINVPTGKDSMSMKQKYPTEEVLAPGTVVISAVGACSDITRVVEPVLKVDGGDIYYINLSEDAYKLGGSSFAQTIGQLGNASPKVNDVYKLKDTFNCIQDLIKANEIVAGHDISSGGLITTLLELCFSQTGVGAEIDLTELDEPNLTKLLFAENCGLIILAKSDKIEKEFASKNINLVKIGSPTSKPVLNIKYQDRQESFDIASLRDQWFETSYLFDKKQSGEQQAKERYQNYKTQPLKYKFPANFNGKLPETISGQKPKAAVLREQGSNSERELAHALYLAGFDVKDVHMTDLITGRETLQDISFLGAVGGFSNSDVLGSAKGWAGSFKYNDKAKIALDNFLKRDDVLSIGICNGCQLFMELGIINPEHKAHGKMTFNNSRKHESNFTSVLIEKNNSVMMSSMEGARLGIWISHGEGKFDLPESESSYDIVGKYGYKHYPANPNGSDYNTAMLCSADGRHLVTMPHLERSIFQWNWAHYPNNRKDEVSPWLEPFINARNWIIEKKKA